MQMKLKNPAYSLRSFARRLQIGPSALSEMLNGKRLITEKSALKILERLNLSPEESNKLMKRLAKGRKAPAREYVQVEMDQYHLIADWFYFGILSLAETEDFKDSPEWIANRLNIGIPQARRALAVLERMKLLKRDNKNRLVHSGAAFRTSSQIPHLGLRKSHFDNLELAKVSLEKDDVTVRDFSSVTMAIDPDLLSEAKELIRDFRRKLSEFLESGKKQEVYKLNIQLFPLSNKEGGK